MKSVFIKLARAWFCLMMLCATCTWAEGFVEGVPVAVQKSNWTTVNVTFVQFVAPVAASGCNSGDGVVILDSNASAKAALAFALTAQASGKKFRCYVQDNQCSPISGAATTYPICGYYPALVN